MRENANANRERVSDVSMARAVLLGVTATAGVRLNLGGARNYSHAVLSLPPSLPLTFCSQVNRNGSTQRDTRRILAESAA